MFGMIVILNMRSMCDDEFAMLRNDPGLLIHGLWKMEFRENFGTILDFPDFPNENKS